MPSTRRIRTRRRCRTPRSMRFILHYTKPGNVVLDGFAGSGMTGVAAQACGSPDANTKATIEAELGIEQHRMGRPKGNPGRPPRPATFIAAGLNLPVDAKRFDESSERLLRRFEDEFGWMYKTTVTPPNGKPFKADIDYTVWSEVFQLSSLRRRGGLLRRGPRYHDEYRRDTFFCPSCGAELEKSRLERRTIKERTFAGDFVERV